MRTESEIKKRLHELWVEYRAKSSDTLDPELKARISELKWVLEKVVGYPVGGHDEWR